MQIRFPWILSRKRLILAACLDATLFYLLYLISFYWRFNLWPVNSFRIAFLLCFWLLGSYISGRYFSGDSSKNSPNGMTFIKQIASTGLVLLLILGASIFHSWLLNQSVEEATFRSFLIPFLGSLAVLSSAVQALVTYFSINHISETSSVWYFVGTSAAYDQLLHKLQWTRLKVSLVHHSLESLKNINPLQIVVEDLYTQDPDTLRTLLYYQQHGATVMSRLAWCEFALQRFPSDFLTEANLLDEDFSIQAISFQTRLKRIGDVVVSLCLLILTSPLLLLSCILIKLTDGGPILYSQFRNGYGGKPYRIWKLRSMSVNAEYLGVQWSSRLDSRVTRVGSLLRRTRVDELPQLFCVLTGSMSLIGPRPERPEFDHKLEQNIPFYKLRYSMRPGLSGWAQVNYPYGASFQDSENKLSYDLYYLRNFSFWLDLLIFLKTVRLVFNGRGSLPVRYSSSSLDGLHDL